MGLIKYPGRRAGIWRASGQDFEIGRVNVNSLPGTPTTFASDLYNDNFGRTFLGYGVSSVPCGTCSDVNYKLYVEGSIAAREIKVTAQNFPDFVFDEKYSLNSISEVQNYLFENKHLPDIPTAEEVSKNNGIEVGAFQVLLLKKIEEQMLYIIDLQKQIDELNNR